jgi:DNA-binding MltR family transcriptional regulator
MRVVESMEKERSRPSVNLTTYNEFVGRFHSESDRAAAVLAGGYLDSFLENALRSVFISGGIVDELFEGHGPLRSLSSKIAMTNALGLATDALARDMNLIRKIRNHFAHHIWDATFDIAPVSDWCREIAVVDQAVDVATGERVKDTNSARLRYLLAIGMATLLLAHSPKVSQRFRELTTGITDSKLLPGNP